MMSTDPRLDPQQQGSARRQDILRSLKEATEGLELYRPEASALPKSLVEGESERIQALRRGRRLRPADDRVGMITLSEIDGVYVWHDGMAPLEPPRTPSSSWSRTDTIPPLQRRSRAFSRQPPRVVEQFKFEKLEPSKVGEFLVALDNKLTPGQQLKIWNGGALAPCAKPTAEKAVLLLVHGTFSNTQHLFDQLNGYPEGREFLAKAATAYDQILAFDHPTVSVSPVLNAVELARLFQPLGPKVSIDVICHSRGGLVTRWWAEILARGCKIRRVIFVAAPLAGTSLAAPPRLRSALNLLTNIGNILGNAAMAASVAVPFLTFSVGIMKVLSSITGVMGRTPLVDAVVAMIPGLACQSQIRNNFELNCLRNGSRPKVPEYFAVKASFQPEEVGWKFWRCFVDLKGRAAALGADLIFREPNDLVVNTESMTQLFEKPAIDGGGLGNGQIINAKNTYDFGVSPTVFHTNYFQQPKTIERFRAWLCLD
jgi:pimeloyl-ACP methyl ester carboxylesterase